MWNAIQRTKDHVMPHKINSEARNFLKNHVTTKKIMVRRSETHKHYLDSCHNPEKKLEILLRATKSIQYDVRTHNNCSKCAEHSKQILKIMFGHTKTTRTTKMVKSSQSSVRTQNTNDKLLHNTPTELKIMSQPSVGTRHKVLHHQMNSKNCQWSQNYFEIVSHPRTDSTTHRKNFYYAFSVHNTIFSNFCNNFLTIPDFEPLI